MKNISVPFIVLMTSVWLLGLIPNAWADSEAKKTYVQLLNEVFQAELVYPQGPGEVQITLGYGFSKGEGGKSFEIPLGIEIGITDSWQVGLEWLTFQQHNPEMGSTESGTGDLGLSTKYAFMNIGGSDVHASLNFGVTFPIADIDKDLTDGFTVYEPSFSLARDFTGNNSQLFTQIGVGFVDRTREPANPANRATAHHEFFWHTGFFIPYNEYLIFSGEFSWVSDELTRAGNENQLYLTPGATWDLPGNWELGVGVPIGLSKESDDYQVIAALIYEFEIP